VTGIVSSWHQGDAYHGGLTVTFGGTNAVECSGPQRTAAERLQAVADPGAAEFETALALRRSGADPLSIRRISSMA